jgi:two-component system CheB/CheR fusion protein
VAFGGEIVSVSADPSSGPAPLPPNGAGSPLEAPEAGSADPPGGFPIVGIGASAGGLAAFEAFFCALPPDVDSKMAFVLVQHLAPDHKSLLAELVKRYTRMQVFEVEDGMKVQPNCAYIIPPNRDMAFLNGALHLLEPAAARNLRLPIDFFFRSLAHDQHERAICIVLSGTGSDGTMGVRAVKGEGGMVMAQNPESTEFDGMPRSAISTGQVDFVLPPAEMPAQLLAYVTHAFGKIPRRAIATLAPGDDVFQKIFIVLRAHTGHDFSRYKQSTMVRRIERRMAVHQIEELGGYLHFLQNTAAEVEELFHDLLIGVTSFFRDPEEFLALETQVIPQLFSDKNPGGFVRVWVPGCSTGEEAYSIAILLVERMEALKATYKVQVFATDLDSKAIDQARRGIYPASIAADVSPERLARFFARDGSGEEGSYRINKALRDLLVFSEHDLIRDPPFSRVGLISCRNLMIYMEAELQKTIIPLFHYALEPGGFLFLGTSETVGDCPGLFASVDRAAKLYQRGNDAPDVVLPTMLKALTPVTDRRVPRRSARLGPGEGKIALRELTERALLRQYDPVGALVDQHGNILYVHGRTGRYLEPAPGEAGMNILKMAREGLRHELAVTLQKATSQPGPVHRKGLQVHSEDGLTAVDLTVAPVAADPEATSEARLFLVTLARVRAVDEDPAEKISASASGEYPAVGSDPESVDPQITALRQELRAKEEYLQATNRELESSNEELKSSNEELQSVNEEVQSTNEELETSKEELQSVNEELATVNAELQQKVADLSGANNDMNNLLAGTGVGTIFVDNKLRIRRFTPTVTPVINLIATDIGRPVGHITCNLVGYDRLVEDLQDVVDTLAARDVEVQTKAGAWYSMGIRPYRTLDNVVEGAVVTFFDITEIKGMRQAQRDSEALRRLAVVVRDAHDAITVQDSAGHILAWNPGAERLYGWTETEALAKNVRDMIPVELRREAEGRVLRLGQTEVLDPRRTRRIAKDGRVIDVWQSESALVNNRGEAYAIATTERPVDPAGEKTWVMAVHPEISP